MNKYLSLKGIIASLALFLILAFASPFQTSAQTGAVIGNFGIDADQLTDTLKFGSLGAGVGTIDWFKDTSIVQGSGKMIIDTTGATTIRAQLQGGQNISFSRRMDEPRYTAVGSNLWVDGVYGRDHHRNPPGPGGIDSTGFIGSFNNGDDPGNWTGGIAPVPLVMDLVDVGAFAQRLGTTSTDHLWIFVQASTIGRSQPRYFDIEIYRNAMTYDPITGVFSTGGSDDGHVAWTFNPDGSVRTPGDLIIAFEWGQAFYTAEFRIWVSENTFNTVNPLNFDFGTEYDGAVINAPFGYANIIPETVSTYLYGIWNTDPVDASSWAPPWGTKNGSFNWSMFYDEHQFFEAGFDLTEIGLDPAIYNGGNVYSSPYHSIMFKSRDASAFTSDLIDFSDFYNFFNDALALPLISGANGFPNVGGSISGLETCVDTDLDICIEATDPFGLPLDIINVTVLSGSGSTWSDPVPGDTCFIYEPAPGFTGNEILEVVVGETPPFCDTVLININVQPETGVYAGSDAAICETEVYTIADANASNYSGLGWVTSGDGTFNDTAIINSTYTPGPNDILAGSATLSLTAFSLGACPDTTDSMMLNISLQPIADAGPDDEICETDGSYTLAGASITNAVSVLWSTDGTGTFDDPTLDNPVYTPSLSDIQDGQINLSVTAYGDGICPDSSDFMILTVWPEAQVYAGQDDTICEGSTFQPLDATALDYTGLGWTTAGDGTFSDTSLLIPVYAQGTADIANGSVVLTLTAFAAGTCPDVTDDLTLYISSQPTSFAGVDAEICETGLYTLADATATYYTSLLWTSTGTGAFTDATALNPTYTPSQDDINAGFVVLTLTAYGDGICPDASDNMTLTITGQASAYAGVDAAICETAVTYTLADATAGEYASVEWSTSGDGSFDDINIINPLYTIGATDITNGSVFLILTAYGNGSCVDAVDTMLLTIGLQPIADAGPDDEMCETDVSYTLAGASATNATSLLWTTDGTGTFNDPTLVNPDYTPSLSDIQTGQVNLTLTAYGDGACPDASDFMVLTIWPEAQVYAGQDDSICEGSTFQPLDATALNYTGLGWTTAGDGTFSDTSLLIPVYTPGTADIANGSVVLTLTAFAAGTCPDVTDDLTLYISSQPSAFAGVDAEICETGLYTLADATATNYTSLLWTSTGTGAFTDATALNPTYTPSQDDINSGFVVLTLTAYGDGICPDASDNMTLTITGQAVAYAGADAAICETTGTYTLADATADEYASLEWSTSGDGFFDDIAILNPIYTIGPNDITNGSVYLILTAYANGSCTDAIDTMQLSISLQPIADAGPDDEMCETDVSYTLAGASATNATSLLWTTNGTGTFDDATIQNPTYTPSISDILVGQVNLTVTAYGDGICPDASDFMVLTIWNIAQVYAGADADICENENYALWDATADDYTALLWTTSGDGTFDNDIVLNPVYTPGTGDIAAGTVVLTLTASSAGVCPDVSDDMVLSITLAPTVFAGADAEICEYDTYEITDATAANYSSLLWTTAGDGSFNDPSLLNPIYTPGSGDIIVGYAALTLTAYGNTPCGDSSDVMLLTITTAPIVYAGPDDEICETEGMYVLADATASDYASLLWTTSGDGTFDADTILNPTYYPGTGDITNGLVTLTITAFGNGSCLDEMDEMELTITLAPLAYAGPDAEICETDTFNLVDATASNYASLLWTTSGDGTFSDPFALNPTYYPGTGDKIYGSAFLSLTAIGNGSCADSTSTMLLTITPAPYAFAGMDAHICEIETYILLDAEAEDYASLLWTTSGDGTFSDPTILHPEYYPGISDILNGGADLALTAYGLGSCDDASDTMTLNISPLPDADAGPDSEMCSSEMSYTLNGAWATNYTSLLWTTSGTGTFSNPNITNPTYTPSTSDIEDGQVVLTMTAYGDGYCPDDEDFMVLTIWKDLEVYAGADAQTCEGDDYWVLDAWADNYESLLWTTTGDGVFDDTGILTPLYTPGSGDIANGFVYLVLTADGMGTCPPVSDTLMLAISSLPVVDAGPDSEICETDVFTVTAASASNYSGLLWSTSGDGSFNDPGIIDPVYTPGTGDINTGSVILTLTAYGNGSCGDESDGMILTISGQAYASTGTGGVGETCEGNSFHFEDANAENYAQIIWATSGDGTFDNPNIMKPVYTPGTNDIASGNVTITMTAVGIGSCEDAEDSMVLTITEAAQANAGIDADICETDSYMLADASASGYAEIIWTSSGDGQFDDPGLVNPTYTPGVIDISSGGVILTMTAVGNGSCEDVSDNMSLQIYTYPTAEAGDPGVICYGDEFQITDADAENYSDLLWTSSGDGTFDDPTILEPVYYAGPNDLADGYAVLTLTAYGYGSCGSASDTVVVGINAAPVVDAGDNQLLEEGEATQLFGTATGGSGDYTWNWIPGDYIINSNAQNPTTFPLFQDTYFLLTVTDNLTGCMGRDTVFVEVEGPGTGSDPVAVDDYDTTYVNFPVVIPMMDNDVIPAGQVVTPYLCGGPNNGIAIINSDNTLTYTPYNGYSGEDTLCYYICTDNAVPLCDTATIYIHVIPLANIEDNITVYSGFTPNGDGFNDTWTIGGIEKYPYNEVIIFNRWGDIIEELDGYDNENVFWNGTYGANKKIPDGTYYYLIKILYEGQEKYIKGWIYIQGSGN